MRAAMRAAMFALMIALVIALVFLVMWLMSLRAGRLLPGEITEDMESQPLAAYRALLSRTKISERGYN